MLPMSNFHHHHIADFTLILTWDTILLCCILTHHIRLVDRVRTAVNVLGDAFGAAIVAHLSRKELASGATEMEEMDRMDQMDNRLDVEKSKLMEIVKFDEEKEEEKTLLVTEDTKAEVVITDNRHL